MLPQVSGFFPNATIPLISVGRFILGKIPKPLEGWTLSMDRTNLKYGKRHINVQLLRKIKREIKRSSRKPLAVELDQQEGEPQPEGQPTDARLGQDHWLVRSDRLSRDAGQVADLDLRLRLLIKINFLYPGQ